MPGLEIAGLAEKLAANGAKQLGDLTLPVDVVGAELENDLPLRVEGVTFTLFGAAGISSFNSPDDRDELGILGSTSDAPGARWTPQIEFRADRTWLRYRAQAAAKAEAGLESSGFGFSLNAESGVEVLSYRMHAASETVGEAVQRDLADPRLIFAKKHVKALAQGEAVAMRVSGRLSTSLELKWADVFAGGLGAIGSLLDAREVFAVKVDAGAAASFAIELEDDFLVVFSRAQQGKIRVAIKKSDRRSLSAAVAARVRAEFADPAAVEQVLGAVVEGILGEPQQKVEALLAKSRLDELGESEREIVLRIADRLGIDRAVDRLTDLRDEVARIEARARTVVGRMATTRVESGFAYEYGRVAGESVLLQATLPDARLDAHHRQLIRGRFGGLLDEAAKPGSAIRLERYLQEKSRSVRHAWGFALSAGTWFALSGGGFRELHEVTRTAADGRRQISFIGSRGYAGKVGGDVATWQVDFNAQMPEFSSSTLPAAHEFDFGLFLSMSLTEKRIKSAELPKLLDQAILWDALTAGGAAEEEERLRRALVGRGATFSYQLRFDDTAFRTLVADLAAKPSEKFALALGEAMPWHPKFGPPRELPTLRRALYGGLWERYLTDRSMPPRSLAALAQTHLRGQGFVALAAFEGRRWEAFRNVAIAGLAESNHATRESWNGFAQGFRTLQSALDEGRAYTKVREAYSALRPLFARSHHVKALGVLLLDLLGDRPELAPHVERACTVKYSEAGRKVVESISAA